eukprot:1837153-Rhodomonas_salina.2
MTCKLIAVVTNPDQSSKDWCFETELEYNATLQKNVGPVLDYLSLSLVYGEHMPFQGALYECRLSLGHCKCTEGASHGYLTINCPVSGETIPFYNGIGTLTTQTCTAACTILSMPLGPV